MINYLQLLYYLLIIIIVKAKAESHRYTQICDKQMVLVEINFLFVYDSSVGELSQLQTVIA